MPPPRPQKSGRAGLVVVGIVAVVLLLGVAVAGIVLVAGRSETASETADSPTRDTEGAAGAATDGVVPAGAPPPTSVNVNTVPWERMASPSGRYSAELPTDASYDSISTPVPGAGVSITIEALFTGSQDFQSAGVGLGLMETDLDPTGSGAMSPGAEANALDNMVSGSVAPQGGTMTSIQTVASFLGEARRFAVSFSNGMVGAGWVAIDEDRAVMVLMVSPPGSEVIAGAAVDRVVGSLRRS